MDSTDSPVVSILHTLAWSTYSTARLYTLIISNMLLTILFFYFAGNHTPNECQQTPQAILNIGKYYYLSTTAYFIITLSARLRIIEESLSHLDLGPTKGKLDVGDLIFLIGWSILNVFVIIAFAKREECPAASHFLTFYFICLMVSLLIIIMSFCCVTWFAVAFTSKSEKKPKQNQSGKEMDVYSRL